MLPKKPRFIVPTLLILVLLALVSLVSASSSASRPGQSPVMTYASEPVVLEPDNPADFTLPDMTESERQVLQEKLLDLREEVALQGSNGLSPGETALLPRPQAPVPATDLVDLDDADYEYDPARSPDFAPEDLILGRNRKNLFALTVSSTLAEPAAVNEGKYVFYMGNTYASYSIDAGASYTDIPFPGGPESAPNPCCDPDVILDEPRATTFYSILYLNDAVTDGAVRIFVRPKLREANTCSYTLETNGDAIPDYPHLGHSNEYLYITMNEVGLSWNGSRVYRYDIDAMADCQAAAGSVYTYGPDTDQKVFVPFEGVWETMYWGMLNGDNDGPVTSVKTFWWPDSEATVYSQDTAISTSTHNNPDCRGGMGNYDFIERYTAHSAQGFRLRGALAREPGTGDEEIWMWWNASDDGTYPNALIRSVTLNSDDRSIVGERHIWNPDSCFGYPAAAINKRGHIGLTMANGGVDGGGGTAAQGYVGIIDDYNWPSVTTVVRTAQATHNRTDGRFGDYFTVRPHSPCNFAWVAANYGLKDGNTDSTHVNAHYAEFLRERDDGCYLRWNRLKPK